MANLSKVFKVKAVLKLIHDGIQVELLVVNDHYFFGSVIEDLYCVQSILREDRQGISLWNLKRL